VNGFLNAIEAEGELDNTLVIYIQGDNGASGKGGLGTLLVDGKQVAQGRIERTLPFRISLDETLDCGEDTGSPVSADYHVPFTFTGELKKVVTELGRSGLTASDEKQLEEANKKLAAVRD